MKQVFLLFGLAALVTAGPVGCGAVLSPDLCQQSSCDDTEPGVPQPSLRSELPIISDIEDTSEAATEAPEVVVESEDEWPAFLNSDKIALSGSGFLGAGRL